MHFPRPPPEGSKDLIVLDTLGLKGVLWSSAYATREKIIHVVLAHPSFDNLFICAREFGPHRVRELLITKQRFLQTSVGKRADRILRNIEKGFELAAETISQIEDAGDPLQGADSDCPND